VPHIQLWFKRIEIRLRISLIPAESLFSPRQEILCAFDGLGEALEEGLQVGLLWTKSMSDVFTTKRSLAVYWKKKCS